ncbi:hypothetical protein Trydic_g9488 [Trypoxylus dichotomus]
MSLCSSKGGSSGSTCKTRIGVDFIAPRQRRKAGGRNVIESEVLNWLQSYEILLSTEERDQEEDAEEEEKSAIRAFNT